MVYRGYIQKRILQQNLTSEWKWSRATMQELKTVVFCQKANFHWFSQGPNMAIVSYQVSSSLENETEH